MAKEAGIPSDLPKKDIIQLLLTMNDKHEQNMSRRKMFNKLLAGSGRCF